MKNLTALSFLLLALGCGDDSASADGAVDTGRVEGDVAADVPLADWEGFRFAFA